MSRKRYPSQPTFVDALREFLGLLPLSRPDRKRLPCYTRAFAEFGEAHHAEMDRWGAKMRNAGEPTP